MALATRKGNVIMNISFLDPATPLRYAQDDEQGGYPFHHNKTSSLPTRHPARSRRIQENNGTNGIGI